MDNVLWGAIIPNEANPDSDHSGSNIVALQVYEAPQGLELIVVRRLDVLDAIHDAPEHLVIGVQFVYPLLDLEVVGRVDQPGSLAA